MPVQLHLFLVGAFSLKEKGRLLQVVVFLVGAFSFKEKSPTITRGSFFSRRFSSEKCPTITVTSFCFVKLQSHSDWSTFLTTETTKTTKAVRPRPDSGN